MRVDISKDGDVEVYAEKDDICVNCSNAEDCPLISALHCEVVVPHYESMDIIQCGVFKSKKSLRRCWDAKS